VKFTLIIAIALSPLVDVYAREKKSLINGIASSPLKDVYKRKKEKKKFDQWFYKRGKRGDAKGIRGIAKGLKTDKGLSIRFRVYQERDERVEGDLSFAIPWFLDQDTLVLLVNSTA
jgi:hypothetical protein